MKITCLQENLNKGLAIVGRAVATHSTLPVLSNVMLETEDSRLRLVATNLEISISVPIGARVEEEGATTVPARLFTDFVGSLPPERIDMELTARTQTLHFNCARFEAKVKGIAAEEFPLVPTHLEGATVRLDAATLWRAINQVVFAASTDESRPILTGALIKFHNRKMVLAAADGFQIAARTTELPEAMEPPMNVVVPARALAEVARILGSSNGEEEEVTITIGRDRNQVLFGLPNGIILVSQLVEGNFPDHQQIIPKEWTTRVTVDTRDLLQAVKIGWLFGRYMNNQVHLEVIKSDTDFIRLSANTPEMGDDRAEVDAVVEGEPVDLNVSARYLMAVLGVADCDRVAIECTTPTAPVVVKFIGDDDYVYVVMPMAHPKEASE